MAAVVDFHVHAFPHPISIGSPDLREKVRNWLKPATLAVHEASAWVRFMPEPLQKGLDLISTVAPLPGLILESSPTDLIQAMEEAQVDLAVVLAYPPFTTNDEVRELHQNHQQIIFGVNLPFGSPNLKSSLKGYIHEEAKVLKIHPMRDGNSDLSSSHFHSQLKIAEEFGIPVVLHTGDRPVQDYGKWLKEYSKVKFILSRMNLHSPDAAIDLCESYSNVFLGTSWQPIEVICEAVRRLGAERVLFESDWPWFGQNISVGRQKIDQGIKTGLLKDEQASLILGENALKLLGMECPLNL